MSHLSLPQLLWISIKPLIKVRLTTAAVFLSSLLTVRLSPSQGPTAQLGRRSIGQVQETRSGRLESRCSYPDLWIPPGSSPSIYFLSCLNEFQFINNGFFLCRLWRFFHIFQVLDVCKYRSFHQRAELAPHLGLRRICSLLHGRLRMMINFIINTFGILSIGLLAL